MSSDPVEALGLYRNSIKRYLAKEIGWHIEKEIGLGDEWRQESALNEIVAKHFNRMYLLQD
ncbi:hypothetical protein F4694_002524 [Bacillus niacini]|uniref:Uncharacterized protein n=1 Tax=Neobacillus niacini TaxID=86668 RepID=A0A852TCM5_9BACI|nr:hypothetical protein [Neobacillus niacini]NYE05749.1 hypothetical protein [Neobacillus niacini]